jgi:hypothetical protein
LAGVLVIFGILAKKKNNWCFVLGMTLYGLDSMISLASGNFLSFCFHIFTMYGIYGGLNASIKLGKDDRFDLQ